MEEPPRSKQRPGMERPYAVLHKNLAEIESRLRELSAANNDGASSYSRHQHQTVCKDVAAKIDFLKALLAAEMEAHASDTTPPPKHILHLVQRLSTVEHALRAWEDGLDGLLADDLRDVSMCSCTHECFDEPHPETEEAEEDDVDDVPEPDDFGPLEDEKAESLASQWNSSAGEDEEIEHGWYFGCRFGSAVAAAVASAAVAAAIGVLLATKFYVKDEEVFLVPT